MKFEKDGDGFFEFIELLYFAYRDFVAEPDSALAKYNFGRAHHRTLYFVWRNPGLRVSQLLEILKVTKQSLNRVLKQLIAEGFIYQEQGEGDRRRRHLYLTEEGEKLINHLSEIQSARINKSFGQMSDKAYHNMCDGLLNLIDEEDQADVVKRFAASRDRISSKE